MEWGGGMDRNLMYAGLDLNKQAEISLVAMQRN